MPNFGKVFARILLGVATGASMDKSASFTATVTLQALVPVVPADLPSPTASLTTCCTPSCWVDQGLCTSLLAPSVPCSGEAQPWIKCEREEHQLGLAGSSAGAQERSFFSSS